MTTRVGNTRYVLPKTPCSLTLQEHGKGKRRSIEMKPSSSVLLAVFVTVLLMTVSEVARAEETGSDRGVQKTPVSPAVSVPEGVGPAASQPGGAGGTGNPVLGRHRRPLYRFNKSDVIDISFALAPEFSRVVLLDYVSGNVFDELLTNAMLFVLPSDLEGLSLALLEAMGAGLCVLVSDIPENLELMDGAGFTFRRGDVADLTRMLAVLIQADSLRADAGRAARRRIEEQYLWPKIAKEIEAAYFEMLGRGPDAAPAHKVGDEISA
jgi:hypothetical protein